MSKSISSDVLLPVAFEFYKQAPGKLTQPPVNSDDARLQVLLRQADDFATFYNHLRRKLEDED